MADELAKKIIAKIEAHGDLKAGSVSSASDLNELGIHSLELTEIIFEIEDEFDIHVEMNTAEAWNNLRNVGDIVAAVRTLIDTKS